MSDIVVTGTILRFGVLDSTLEVIEPNGFVELKQGVPISIESGKKEEEVVGFANLKTTDHGIDAEMHFLTSKDKLDLIESLKPHIRGMVIEKQQLELLGVMDNRCYRRPITLLTKVQISGVGLSVENTDNGIETVKRMKNDGKK